MLCACTSMGRCPAACTASVWKGTPCSRQTAPISAMGRIEPISLLASHDRHEAGVRTERGGDLRGRDRADEADRQQLDLEALLFELFQRVQHGMVLEGGRNNVLFAPARPARPGQQRLIIRPLPPEVK